MLSTLSFVFVAALSFCAVSFVSAAEPTILQSPNVTDFGKYGKFENCSGGNLVTAFQIKVEPKHSLVDDTALNSIRFFCGQPPTAVNSTWENVTSKVGPFGNWGYIFNCSTYAVGFELESQEYQGPRKDDVAASNIKIHCADNTVIEGFNNNGHTFKTSAYTALQKCPTDQAFCGIQTQVENYQAFGDDTTLNNIRVKCCDIVTQSEYVPAVSQYPIMVEPSSTSATAAASEPSTAAAEPSTAAP